MRSLNGARRALAASMAGALTLAVAGAAHAAGSGGGSVTATAEVSLTILEPMTLVKTADLAFGALVLPSAGTNTVTIDQNSGARRISGGGNGSLAASGGSRASYTLGGAGGAAFSVHLPTTINMTRSGGAEVVPVALAASTQSGSLNGAAGTSGTATFAVGGQLQLSVGMAPGSYVGTFDVTVGYN